MPKGGLWDVDGFPSAMVDGHFTHHGQVGFSYIPITYILSTVLSFAKDSLSRYFMIPYLFASFDIKTSFWGLFDSNCPNWKHIIYGGIQQLRGQNFAIPSPTWTVFIPWAWTKTDIFDPLPPHLVHVVIEWSLMHFKTANVIFIKAYKCVYLQEPWS